MPEEEEKQSTSRKLKSNDDFLGTGFHLPRENWEGIGSTAKFKNDNDAMKMGRKIKVNNLIETIKEHEEEIDSGPKIAKQERRLSLNFNDIEESKRQKVISKLPMGIRKLFYPR